MTKCDGKETQLERFITNSAVHFSCLERFLCTQLIVLALI